jgi:hypothetical protein
MDTTQKYKLDVDTLLRTVMSLEAQFAEQARQTSIPYWATDLVNRISGLESANESLQKNLLDVVIANKLLEDRLQQLGQSNSASAATAAMGSPERHARDDTYGSSNISQSKLIEKIRNEYEIYVQNVRNNMELKFTSLSVEIERAYKLIQSRPTTTDFQHMIHQIQTLETKLYENVQEVSSTMKTTIQDNISHEMSHIVSQLKNNENLTDQNFQLIFTKFDNQANDVEKIRGNMREFTEFVKSNLEEINAKSTTFTAQVEENKDKIAHQFDELSQRMAIFEENQNAATESYVDIKATISRRLLGIDDIILQHDAKHSEAGKVQEAKLNRMNEQLVEIEDSIKQLRLDSEQEQLKLSEHLLSHDERIRELEEHGQSVDDEIDIMQSNHNQTMTKIAGINNHINYHASKLEDLEVKLAKQEMVNSAKYQIIDSLQEQILKVNGEAASLSKKLKDVLLTSESISSEISQLQAHDKKIDVEITKLNLIWDETSAIREALKTCENREGSQHYQLVKLTESLNEVKTSISSIQEENIQRESNLQTRLQELQEALSRRDRSVVSSPKGTTKTGTSASSATANAAIPSDLLQQVHTLSHRMDEMTIMMDLINSRESIAQSDGMIHGHHIPLQQPAAHHPVTHDRHHEPAKHHAHVDAPHSHGSVSSHHSVHSIPVVHPQQSSQSPRLPAITRHSPKPSPRQSFSASANQHSAVITEMMHASTSTAGSPRSPTAARKHSTGIISIHAPHHHHHAGMDDTLSEPETVTSQAPVHAPTTGILAMSYASHQPRSPAAIRSPSNQQPMPAAEEFSYPKQPFINPVVKVKDKDNDNRSLSSSQSKLPTSNSYKHHEDASQVESLSSSKPSPSDVQSLIELCQAYEDQCVQRSNVLDFTDIITETIAAVSRRQAAHIAASVDEEVVRNTIHSDENAFLTDDAVSQARQSRVLRLLDDVREVVVKRQPHPGIIRIDSREKFFKKLKMALDMWLSKYDQVFVIGNSRLGRVKIPSCIACDRPLLRKVSL